MKLLLRLYVVVVVVGERLEPIWVVAEGPEAVQMNIVTDLKCQACHN